jgi:GNAT superfamily N-acetyltransferase
MTALLNTPHQIRMRRFTPDDYPAIVALHNLHFPDYADTPEQWRFYDERREEKIRWGRLVAENDSGAIIGDGSYSQSTDMYHPQKFHVDVCVHPDYIGQGIGKGLYEQILEAIAPYDPILVRCNVREDYTRGVRFLTDRGYVEEQRDWESRLDPRALEFEKWRGAKEKLTAQGILCKSLVELSETDPDWKQKLYEMDWTIVLDMPAPDVLTKPTFEHFEKTTLQNPDFLPAGWFIALDGDQYVGESSLWKSSTDDSLYVGATGVLREYRRRGIATALKIYAIEYAASVGCPLLKTWNAQSNRAMLSINEALGFEKQPAWISYAKTLKTEE